MCLCVSGKLNCLLYWSAPLHVWIPVWDEGDLLSQPVSWLTSHTQIGHFFSQLPYLNGRENYFQLLCKGSWKPMGETLYSRASESEFSFRVIFWRRGVTQSIPYWRERRNMGVWFSREWMVQKDMTGFFVLQNNRAEKLRLLRDWLLYSICNISV